MRRCLSTIFLTGSILLLAGCGSRKVVTKFYVLEKPENFNSLYQKQESTIDSYCEISPVDIYPAYASQRIANRNDSHELVYYGFHQWAVRPGESLTLMLQDFLEHKAVFKGISQRFWKREPEFKLTTTFYQLEILQRNDGLSAHVSLEFRLQNYENDELILLHTADHLREMENSDLNLFAKAISEIFLEELNEFTLKIMEQVPVQ